MAECCSRYLNYYLNFSKIDSGINVFHFFSSFAGGLHFSIRVMNYYLLRWVAFIWIVNVVHRAFGMVVGEQAGMFFKF